MPRPNYYEISNVKIITSITLERNLPDDVNLDIYSLESS